MKKKLLPLFLLIILTFNAKGQSYNNLWIPDTLSGTDFNLRIIDTFAQIVNTGNQTITGAINGKFWGPTLFVNKGDQIQMNVQKIGRAHV
jgi:FtsP/CotA-like multicopper oxidase with cupredoxin domain